MFTFSFNLQYKTMKEKRSSMKKYGSQMFDIICCFAAIFAVCWCINEYSHDHDFAEIKFQKFQHTPDDIYPSITICDENPFVTKNFEEYFDKSLNLDVLNAIDVDIDETKKTNEDCIMARYKRFLEGDKNRIKDNGCSLLQNNTYDQLIHSFRAADYDDLTISLTELISEFSITIPIGFEPSVIRYNITSDKFIATEQFINKEAEIKSWQNHSMEGFELINAYVSMRRSFFKCFTFDIPRAQDIRIREVSITLNTSIFEYGTSPSQFFFYLTYPNQLFGTTMGSRNKLSAKDATSQYKFAIKLGPMKVVKRRDKDRDRCNVNLKNHDNLHLEHIIEKVGCNPTYWKIPSTYPNCSTPEQLYAINEQLGREDNFMPPCRSVAQIQKTVEGQSPCRWFCQGDPYLKLLFFLDQEVYYEEIVLMPSYSLQSLVGNAGGYIGLLVGFTIAQIPDLIFKLQGWIKELVFILLGKEI